MIRIKRRSLIFKKWTFDRAIYILFLLLAFFIPMTKLSVPAMARYELTVGDLTLLLLTALCILTKKGMRKSFLPFFSFLLLLVGACFASSVMVINWQYYFLSMIPFVFSIMITYVTLSYFSTGDLYKRISVFRKLLLFSLIISAIPPYLQVFIGYKNIIFYDSFGWRYTFLAQNPNQFGVYTLLYFYMVTLITIKFYPKKLGTLLLFQLFFFIPVFFSGSRSTTLVFTANFGVLSLLYLWNSSFIKKIFIVGFVTVVTLLFFPTIMNTIENSAGQVRRALAIFDAVADVEEFEIGGSIGHSVDDALFLFKKYPVFGVGLGNKPEHATGVEIHNTFMLFLGETGIVGITMFMLMYLLTPLYSLFSRSKFQFILLVITFFILFAAQNSTGMLFRQRWVWLFMCITFVLVNVDEKGKYQTSKLAIFN